MSKPRLKPRQQPQRSHLRISTKLTTWLAVAVVGGAVLWLLGSSLLRPPTDSTPVPLLVTADRDIAAITRMLGDITIDNSFPVAKTESLDPRLIAVESLIRERRLEQVRQSLNSLRRRCPTGMTGRLHAVSGLAWYESGQPDRALAELRRAADSSTGHLATWSAFAVAWLFQSRGFADSALVWYQRTLTTADSTSFIAAAAHNNIAVVLEKRRELVEAAKHFAAAATVIDTADTTTYARTLRDNLRRLSPL